jgi:hypothetical protein
MLTETLAAPGGSNEIVATTPLAIIVEFRPTARQVNADAFPAQLIDFPVANNAGPAETLKPVTLDG